MDNSAEELDSLLAQFEEELKAGYIDPDDVGPFVASAIHALEESTAAITDSEGKRAALAAIAHFWEQRDEIERRFFNIELQAHRGQF